MRLADGDGRDVPEGYTGEIILKTPARFVGYWEDPASTSDAIRDGWFHTGDLAHRDADGYVWFDGRKKEIIVRGVTTYRLKRSSRSFTAIRQCLKWE